METPECAIFVVHEIASWTDTPVPIDVLFVQAMMTVPYNVKWRLFRRNFSSQAWLDSARSVCSAVIDASQAWHDKDVGLLPYGKGETVRTMAPPQVSATSRFHYCSRVCVRISDTKRHEACASWDIIHLVSVSDYLFFWLQGTF